MITTALGDYGFFGIAHHVDDPAIGTHLHPVEITANGAVKR